MRGVSVGGAAGKEDPKCRVSLKDRDACRLRGIPEILNEVRDFNPLAGGELKLERLVSFLQNNASERPVLGGKRREREGENSEGDNEGFHKSKAYSAQNLPMSIPSTVS